MLTTPNPQGFSSIATAFHVIDHARQWEEPIKLIHAHTKKSIFLRRPERYIFTNIKADLAVIVFMNEEFTLPTEDPILFPEDKYIKPGIQIGWAGYPAVAPNDFSFFSGSVSCYLSNEQSYLVDGVAINGVSGGPAFCVLPEEKVHIICVVTAYVPNRVSGESLSGVCFVAGVAPLYNAVKHLKISG